MIPNPMMGGMGNLGNIMNMVSQIKANPRQFLQRRFNLPQNVSLNDPQSIVNHLVSTGQISQDQVNAAYQMMQRFR